MKRDFFSKNKSEKIELTNDGDLQIYFVGVGSAFARNSFQSNMIVVKGKNHVMIDMGSKAPVVLWQAGISVGDIENLLVTHSHADHIGGVEEWCLRARYDARGGNCAAPGSYKPNLITTADYAHILWDASLRGGLEYSEGKDLGQRLALADYVTLKCGEYIPGHDRPVYSITVGSIDIKLMRTNHLPNSAMSWWSAFYSVGILIDNQILISGDTLLDRKLLETFGKDALVIFHDCQDFKGGVHASYEELTILPMDLKSKIYLYHLPDSIRENFDPKADGFLGWAEPYTEGSYIFSKKS